jgi:hypothetical protein
LPLIQNLHWIRLDVNKPLLRIKILARAVCGTAVPIFE